MRERATNMAETAEPEHIAISKSTGIKIDWKDGHHSEYSLAYLRDECPCATCTGAHGTTPQRSDYQKPEPFPDVQAEAEDEFRGAGGALCDSHLSGTTGIAPASTRSIIFARFARVPSVQLRANSGLPCGYYLATLLFRSIEAESVASPSGFRSPSIVGTSSETVGWMCIAR